MSAEFFVRFDNTQWYSTHRERLLQSLASLKTYVNHEGDTVLLCGTEPRTATDWSYDVRLFLLSEGTIVLEVSAHPPSIEADIRKFLSWLRSQTQIDVVDEDGEPTAWS